MRAVAGRVLDPRGEPIEGAAVWLSDSANRLSLGAVAAHSDGEGAFEVQVPREGKLDMSLWAVHSDFGPSSLVSVALAVAKSREEATAVSVDLQLVADSGRLRCGVRDVTGRPLVDAVVQIIPDNLGREPQAPVFGRTDAQGQVEFGCLPIGPAVMVVRQQGFASASTRALVRRGVASVEVTLLVRRDDHRRRPQGKRNAVVRPGADRRSVERQPERA